MKGSLASATGAHRKEIVYCLKMMILHKMVIEKTQRRRLKKQKGAKKTQKRKLKIHH